LLAQVVTIALGFVIPRLTLVHWGSETNGLMSSVGSMLTYMSLLEAGVGTAALQALYGPIAREDRASTNRIMSAVHQFYKRTGIIYLGIVLILSVIYTLFVQTELPKATVFAVILLSGLSGVLSYFFQGKFTIFLSAEGKSYVTTNITTVISVAVDFVKVALLMLGGNVVMLQVVYFGFNLLRVVIYSVYMHRHYAWIDYHACPDTQALSQRKAVLIHQISGLIFNNTDVLILTVLATLKTVSVYNMYMMIFGMVKAIGTVLSGGYTYALGQAYNSDRNRFVKLFDIYETYTISIMFSLYCVCGILILPFLKLYTAGIDDISYIDNYLPWLFVTYFLLHNGRTSSGNVINFAQKFEETKWRSILESGINLTVTIVLTAKIGIYGALLGTIAALLYRTNDMILFASRILERSAWITYRRWISNVILVFLLMIVFSKIELPIDSYFSFLVWAVILTISIALLFMIVCSIMELDSAKYLFRLLKTRCQKNTKENHI